ncbi:helix-turn-helix domain-containing protein [Bordetella tumbae]|uniref:helix-turn-helix domain-containing protein n=1 Tax=Bordetella tumbae TaxID=1649139 RepID=UPI0039EEE8B7
MQTKRAYRFRFYPTPEQAPQRLRICVTEAVVERATLTLSAMQRRPRPRRQRGA